MKSVAAWNIGLLVVSLASSTAVGWAPRLRSQTPVTGSIGDARSQEAMVDREGVELPAANYTRIASVSTVADEILWEICEPDRVVSVTGYSARTSARSYRFTGKATLESVNDVEKILTLHPDLVLVSSFGDDRPIARLRGAGLHVFDLGAMRGLETLLPNIRQMAAIVGHPERGERLTRALDSGMSGVAADIPASARRRAMYLSMYGGHLFGAARGTSYHDVLASAGLMDAAAGFRDWPEYSVEQVLGLDPDVIVTNAGMRDRICEHAGFAALRACASPDGMVAVDEGLLGDPGPAMLDAAETIRPPPSGAPPPPPSTKP